jgi:GNAT superfamily N-acetyltransferase
MLTPKQHLIISEVREADLPAALGVARTASEADIFPTLSELGQQTLRKAQEHDIADIVHKDYYRALKAEIDNRLAGYVAWRNGDYLAQLYVDPAWQGRGIGTALLDRMVNEVTQARIKLRASLNAVSFYERYGFVQTGEVAEANNIRFVPMEYQVTK